MTLPASGQEAVLSPAIENTQNSEQATQARFTDFKLDPRITAAITAAKFVTPTDIQARAIPHLLEGKDLLGIAQTGTGKTAAFALPILEKLASSSVKGIQALIMVPTRELAQQVLATFKQLAGATRVRTITVYGGMSFNIQFRDLRSGAQVLVACPGRLLDHIQRGTIDLTKVSTLVLDEADQMFDMGFLPTVRRIVKMVPEKRQTMLFSATMPSEIKHLAMEMLRDPVTAQVSPIQAASTISHAGYLVAQNQKAALLVEMMRTMDSKSTLVFTRTKHRAKKLAEDLEDQGFSATSLQGNLSQNQRDRAMNGFRSGRFQVLVATDIAARGIDVASVSHVINFDLPATVEAYLHRVGRTGRATRSGDAISLIAPEDRSMIRAIEHKLRLTLEKRTIEGFEAPAFQERSDSGQRRPRRQHRDNRRAARPQEERQQAQGESRPSFNNEDRRPRRFQNDRSENRNDRPRSDRPHFDRPRSDRPRSDRPRSDRPHSDRPHSDRRPTAAPTHSHKGFGERAPSERGHSERGNSERSGNNNRGRTPFRGRNNRSRFSHQSNNTREQRDF